jgi:Zn-dependent protease
VPIGTSRAYTDHNEFAAPSNNLNTVTASRHPLRANLRRKTMRDSWKLGRLCGIDIFLHWSFLIVPAWVALASLAAGATLASAVNATFFIFAIFGCVLLHELGHALAARRYGIATQDITLLPIGGLARLDSIPTRPLQEIVIALAGPAVNLVIAAALASGLSFASSLDSLWAFSPLRGSFLVNLAVVNLGLLAFNLLPAFPMDGGRVLRALLAIVLPYGQATWAAATVSQFLAAGMGAFGLLTGSANLMFVALFVFLAARREANEVAAEAHADAQPVAAPQLALDDSESSIVLPAAARADEVSRLLFQRQNFYPVAQGGEVVGVVSKGQLLWAIANGHGDRLIAELMNHIGGYGRQAVHAAVRARS